MKAHMTINGELHEVRWCDTTSHEPRFATTRLGWTPTVGSDCCAECASTWQAYAAELGGDVFVEMLTAPPVMKRGVA